MDTLNFHNGTYKVYKNALPLKVEAVVDIPLYIDPLDKKLDRHVQFILRKGKKGELTFVHETIEGFLCRVQYHGHFADVRPNDLRFLKDENQQSTVH